MNKLKVGSLFSGIGGIDLGFERAGYEIAWQVEIDPWCCRVLERHWPGVRRFGDIKQCTALNPSVSLSLEVPAKTSVAPENAPGSSMAKPLNCFGKPSGLWGRWLPQHGAFIPESLYGKTLQGLFPPRKDEILRLLSTRSPESRLPRAGCLDTSSGELYELRTSATRTKGKGYSLWPTARGEDSESCGNHPGAVDSLTGAAGIWTTPRTITGGPESAMWQTPAADSFRSRGGDRINEQGLDQQARFFPTPGANDYKGSAKLGQRRGQLDEAAEQKFHMPLPAPETTSPGPQSSNAGPGSHRPSKRRLSPIFVSWLMGFPLGWAMPEPYGNALTKCIEYLTKIGGQR